MALYTLTRAPEVDEAIVKASTAWDVWDSKGDPTKFPFEYPVEERVLIICGKAELTPDDGSEPFTIEAGDAVRFHVGFACNWKVLEPMKKYFQYYGDDGKECGCFPDAPKIACDNEGCGKECWDESFYTKGGLDICPRCFKKARGAEKKSYIGAQHQKKGEAFVEEEEAPKPKRKRAKTKAAPRRQQKKGVVGAEEEVAAPEPKKKKGAKTKAATQLGNAE